MGSTLAGLGLPMPLLTLGPGQYKEDWIILLLLDTAPSCCAERIGISASSSSARHLSYSSFLIQILVGLSDNSNERNVERWLHKEDTIAGR